MDFLAAGTDTVQHVQHWIAAGGYVVLFGLLFACGLGLPLPEDIPLLIAGALCATGKMHLVIASVAAWCGIIGGDLVLYHMGKKFGLEITRVPFVGKHVTKARIERAEQFFERYGIWVVAIGRMFAGIRGAMVVAAGATRFNFWKFLITDGLAALVSGGLFVALGYWLGSNMDALVRQVNEVKDLLLSLAIVIAVVFIVWFWRRYRRRRRLRLQRTRDLTGGAAASDSVADSTGAASSPESAAMEGSPPPASDSRLPPPPR